MHKQQEMLFNHLSILRIVVSFSGESCEIMANEALHVFDGVRVRFASEMFGRVDKIVCMPIVRYVKLFVD